MKILKKGGVVEKRGRRKRNPCPMRLWSYVSCLLRHFILFCRLRNSPFSNKDHVIYISQSRMPNQAAALHQHHIYFRRPMKSQSYLRCSNFRKLSLMCIAFTIKILKAMIDYWNKNSNKLYSRCQSMIRNIYTFLTKIFQKSSSITRIYKTVIFPQIDRYVYSISQTQSQNLVSIWHN